MSKHIAFILTMPNRGSWNGRWSGEANTYAVVYHLCERAWAEYSTVLKGRTSFYYSWGDGWGASISVKTVDSNEARRLRRVSKGFCGYEWMIASILKRGKILADHQVPDNEGDIPSGEVGPFAVKTISPLQYS